MRIVGAAILAAMWFLPSSAMALDCAADQRPFQHAAGEICIPKAPQRIVALRHDSIATPLIDLGAPLIATVFQSMPDGSTYVRGASDIFGQSFVDSLQLTSVGNAGAPGMEVVASLEPDLIIMMDYQSEDYLAQSQGVAPTVVVPFNLPFLEHLQLLADAAGLSGTYEMRLAAYREKIDTVRQIIGTPSNIVISRFDMGEGGLWYYPNWGAVDQVIDDIGFSRPPIQAEATENFTDLSFERVREFDGDILISSRALRFGQSAAALQEQWDAYAPLWRRLDAVQRGDLFWYDRDVWVGYTFKSLDIVADGLLLLTADRLAK